MTTITTTIDLCGAKARTRVHTVQCGRGPRAVMLIGQAGPEGYPDFVRDGAVIFLSREQIEEHRAYLNGLDIDQLFKEPEL